MSAAQELMRRRTMRMPTPEECALGDNCNAPDSSEWRTCRGAAHRVPLRVHVQCANPKNDADPWFCEYCCSVDEQEPNSQGTMGSQQPDWAVVGILETRQGEEGEMLKVEWAPRGGKKFPKTWIPADDVQDGELLQRFRRNRGSVAVWDPDFDRSDDEAEGSLFAKAIARASDLSQVAAVAAVAQNPYATQIGNGFTSLLAAVWPEVKGHRTVTGMQSSTFRICGLEILASTPAEVFLAICSGSFTARKEKSKDLTAVMDKYTKGRRPCIYVVELAEVDGQCLRMWQMQRLVDRARAYVNRTDDNFAVRIHKKMHEDYFADEDLPQQIKSGDRPLLSETMEQNALRLCDYIERELSNFTTLGYQYNTPIPYVLRHIGYAIDGRKRMKAHLAHGSSSNPLLNLFGLIAKADRDLDGVVLHSHVIFQCWHQLHGSVAEILFSIVAGSYIETGRGFNSVPAGGSNSSVEAPDIQREWPRWVNNMLIRSSYHANLDEEEKRVADYEAKLENAKQKILQHKRVEMAAKTRMLDLCHEAGGAATRLDFLRLSEGN